MIIILNKKDNEDKVYNLIDIRKGLTKLCDISSFQSMFE